MRAGNPVVTVAIPCYNGADFLARSVSSVLNQSFSDFEIVVTDDGSTDNSLEVLETFDDDRIRIYPGERIGAEGNWNRAISLAEGEFVKLLPQDDLLHPECLERQVAALRTHTAIGLAACRRDVIRPDGTVILKRRGLAGLRGVVSPQRALRAIIRSGTNLVGEGGAVLLRTRALHEVGGFDGIRPYVIDLDLWVRVIKRTGFYADPAVLASFRISPNAWTVDLGRVQTEQMRSLFAQLKDDRENDVGPITYAIGWIKAGLTSRARRAVYWRTNRKNRERPVRRRDAP